MRLKFNRPTLKIERRFVKFEVVLLALILALTAATSRTQADTGVCSGQTITLPFTDVMGSAFFCTIAQLYFQGITLGTTPTTYSPADNVTREQMAAFLARTQNSVLNRGSRRAALNQFWTTTPQYTITAGIERLGTTAVDLSPSLLASDGLDIWVANFDGGSVSRVRASDGKRLEGWAGATEAIGVLVAMGRVFVTGATSPGRLYMIDPRQPAGTVTTITSNLGNGSYGIAFDGARIWTTNIAGNSVSIITPGSPFTVTNVPGFSFPTGVLYDGTNIWVTNGGNGTLVKLDANGGILQTITVGSAPSHLIYDGTNIWVPNSGSNSVTVVRPVDGMVLATLTGNGLNAPNSAAFDGQRILVTNTSGDSVSLWKAADLTPRGSFSTGAGSRPLGACSDGLNFWVTLNGRDSLARF